MNRDIETLPGESGLSGPPAQLKPRSRFPLHALGLSRHWRKPAFSSRRISALQQIWGWFRYHNRTIWRTPISTFFVILLPLVMMVTLSTFIEGSLDYGSGTPITFENYYVPAMAAFSAASATYTNLCIAQ